VSAVRNAELITPLSVELFFLMLLFPDALYLYTRLEDGGANACRGPVFSPLHFPNSHSFVFLIRHPPRRHTHTGTVFGRLGKRARNNTRSNAPLALRITHSRRLTSPDLGPDQSSCSAQGGPRIRAATACVDWVYESSSTQFGRARPGSLARTRGYPVPAKIRFFRGVWARW
jgi:hypothetical protein